MNSEMHVFQQRICPSARDEDVDGVSDEAEHADRERDLPGVAQAKVYRLIVYFADSEDVMHASAILYG